MFYEFYCPGCKESHKIKIGKPGWEFSGSSECPTISPSILVTTGCKCPSHKADDDCWCTFDGPSPFKCSVCHSFIRDGKIEYLLDCTHALAGQVIDLPKEKGAK